MLRASFTKHFGSRAQPCPYAAKFWPDWFSCKCPLPTEAIGTGEIIPRATPQGFSAGSTLSSDATWILNIISPSTSPCWVEFFHIVMSTDPTGQGCIVRVLQSFSFGGAGWFPPILSLGNWSWELGRALPGITEEVRGSNRNWICQTLALLSPWDSHLLLWVQTMMDLDQCTHYRYKGPGWSLIYSSKKQD